MDVKFDQALKQVKAHVDDLQMTRPGIRLCAAFTTSGATLRLANCLPVLGKVFDTLVYGSVYMTVCHCVCHMAYTGWHNKVKHKILMCSEAVKSACML